jgi:hypothetical protein
MDLCRELCRNAREHTVKSVRQEGGEEDRLEQHWGEEELQHVDDQEQREVRVAVHVKGVVPAPAPARERAISTDSQKSR